VIFKVHDTYYMFHRHDQKLVVFTFLGHFRELLSTVWVSGVIFKAHETKYMFDRHDQKLIIFAFMAVFVSYCPLFWGYGGDLYGT
jgi:hypothetical protein